MTLRSLLRTSACSSRTSLINVVVRPFRSNGVFYAAGTVISDPAAIRYYRGKVNEGKIVAVDEHNLERVSLYVLRKSGEDVSQDLRAALGKAPTHTEEYLEKVKAAATKYEVNMDGKTIEEVVAEVKQKASASKE